MQLNNRYMILEQVSEGVQSTIYKLFDTRTGGVYAYKKYKKHVTMNEAFAREKMWLQGSKLSGIACLIDIVEDDENLGFVMEWIEGVPLTEWVVLKSKDELNQMALQYLTVKIEFLRNCQFKPFQNMHYVDLKPEHIFVDSSGRLRFIDFGLCTIGDNSPWIGYGESPFTAPFAFISKKYSLQSDLYAISSIALFILNGGTILDAMNRNNSWTFGVPYWMIDLLLKMRECNDNYQYQDFQSLDLDWTKKRVA